ncbi:MAG TPA: EF-hand domain-containing protein [Rhodanobacter sp.]|nr:EF-hand domain-containing protein [Rhodanobacter sp.]
MKFRKPFLTAMTGSALLFAALTFAQDVPPPPPPSDMAQAATSPPPPPPPPPSNEMAPPAQPMPPAQPTPESAAAGSAAQSATYQTPQGQVVVNSAPAPAPTIGPAPDFNQLSGGSKSITPEQAASYPPLANDFLNADSNKDGKISKSEYARWMKQLN